MDVSPALQNVPGGQADHAAARTERLQNGAGTRITGGVFSPKLWDQNGIVGKIEVDIAGGQPLPRLPDILAQCKLVGVAVGLAAQIGRASCRERV